MLIITYSLKIAGTLFSGEEVPSSAFRPNTVYP